MSLHRLRKSDTVPAVGRDIDAWCTRCKLDLGHVITAMSGDTVVQVRCNTCGSVHRYKDPAAADRAATRRVAQTTGAGARRAATAAAARPSAIAAAPRATTRRSRRATAICSTTLVSATASSRVSMAARRA